MADLADRTPGADAREICEALAQAPPPPPHLVTCCAAPVQVATARVSLNAPLPPPPLVLSGHARVPHSVPPPRAAHCQDRSIGPIGMRPGYGYGGPCYPRDNQALALYARQIGIDRPPPSQPRV